MKKDIMDTLEFKDIEGFNNRVLLPRTSCELLFTIPGKIILLPKNGIISDYKKRAENLISEENKQNLKLVEAKIQQEGVSVVGINTIPENASIIINIMGPSNNTIKTQVGMLGYGGKLITTESKLYASNITIAFPLYAGKVLVGQVIERTGV
jgi:hypothetical protein